MAWTKPVEMIVIQGLDQGMELATDLTRTARLVHPAHLVEHRGYYMEEFLGINGSTLAPLAAAYRT